VNKFDNESFEQYAFLRARDAEEFAIKRHHHFKIPLPIHRKFY